MVNLRRRRQFKSVLFSRVVVVILVVLVVILGKATWSVFSKSSATNEKLERARQEREHLEEREEFLIREIERLSTEEGIEEEIRIRFGIAKEGERMFVVTDVKESTSTDEIKRGFWASVRKAFTGE